MVYVVWVYGVYGVYMCVCAVCGIFMYIVCRMYAYAIMDYTVKFRPAVDCMYYTEPTRL